MGSCVGARDITPNVTMAVLSEVMTIGHLVPGKKLWKPRWSSICYHVRNTVDDTRDHAAHPNTKYIHEIIVLHTTSSQKTQPSCIMYDFIYIIRRGSSNHQ